MARKNPLSCETGSKRFTVLRVNGDDYDIHTPVARAAKVGLATHAK